ncbi:MAG: L-aspartate oxidase [bacterium]|nr:L-aspartate oxidase [bacterium]
MKNEADVIIVGCGVAGLFCALNLPRDKQILMITKDALDHSDSFLAQGGICVMRDEDDYDGYFEDTMKAGHYENDPDSVEVMIRSSREIINDLIGYGVDFEQENGQLLYTREGAHRVNRILFHKDITGKEITRKLLAAVQTLDNVTIKDYCTMVDIIEEDNTCYGVVVRNQDDSIELLTAPYTVFACGGIGGLFDNSTNFPHLTGDALAISLNHEIELENPDYIQIHPTTLYSTKPGRRFLISESVRGEGAILLNKNKERFVNELLPRDIVTREIHKQMKKDNMPYVWLSMAPIDQEEIMGHFPNIYAKCMEEGYDPTKECIPVVPSQHYFMGGIHVDLNSRTTMDNLYAVGETSCNGVHGANRLASNSLLESLVFAKRAAHEMTEQFPMSSHNYAKALANDVTSSITLADYEDKEALAATYKQMILEEIERMKKEHEQSNHHEVKRRSVNYAGA